jgi:hypothetical protein
VVSKTRPLLEKADNNTVKKRRRRKKKKKKKKKKNNNWEICLIKNKNRVNKTKPTP